ncbi:PrsW family intramembrane metalloprotease [Nonomuraea sp. NPDC049152]|uniref:PrsW family intramembrane metalloprotease n=1 Tax=Nonomuraea sp. NPDC049152 TaxID=3154350 RepID=UPI0033E83465
MTCIHGLRAPLLGLRLRPSRQDGGLIVAIVISGLCALGYLASLMPRLGGSVADLVLSIAVGLAPLPVLLVVVLAIDQLTPKPRLNLVFAFAWGGGIALLAAAVLTKASGGGTATTPLFEEMAKGAALLWLLWWRRHAITSLTVGIVYAAMAGLGFATVENVTLYLTAFARGGHGDVLTMVVHHGLGMGIAHPLCASLAGLGIAYAVIARGGTRFPIALASCAGAVLLHILWNDTVFSASHLPAGQKQAYVVCAAVVLVLTAVIVLEHRLLVATIGRHLLLYRATGLVTPDDIAMLSSGRARWQTLHQARTPSARRAMADYQRAATELVILHQRAERDNVPPNDHDRDERLAVMTQARARLRAAAL